MMDKQTSKFVFECDGCTEVLETNTSSFASAKELLDAEGWHARKVNDEWEHFCSRCSKRNGADKTKS
jgi:hypothetical protein